MYRLSLQKYLEPTKYLGFGIGVMSVAMLPLLVLSQKDTLVVNTFILASKFEMLIFWSFITLHSVAMLKVVHSTPIRIYFR